MEGSDDVDVDATAATSRMLDEEVDVPTGCMATLPRGRW
jgi:hypothetical protein